jgi:hypothetical protein
VVTRTQKKTKTSKKKKITFFFRSWATIYVKMGSIPYSALKLEILAAAGGILWKMKFSKSVQKIISKDFCSTFVLLSLLAFQFYYRYKNRLLSYSNTQQNYNLCIHSYFFTFFLNYMKTYSTFYTFLKFSQVHLL